MEIFKLIQDLAVVFNKYHFLGLGVDKFAHLFVGLGIFLYALKGGSQVKAFFTLAAICLIKEFVDYHVMTFTYEESLDDLFFSLSIPFFLMLKLTVRKVKSNV